MSWSLWSNHGDIHRGRRLDGAETNVEAVREHQSLAGLEIWFDGVPIKLGLFGVRHEDHDDVGPGGSFRGRVDLQARLFSFGAGGASFVEADADGYAAITKIQGVRVTL